MGLASESTAVAGVEVRTMGVIESVPSVLINGEYIPGKRDAAFYNRQIMKHLKKL